MAALLRFAPSPTGGLHLGGLRMALLNQLVSRKLGGKWILRIEDTDQKRLVQGSLQDIQGGLSWAGLEYDYGPGRGGPHGPYFQSDRLDLYHSHAKHLLDSGNAYKCFCKPGRLIATKERLQKAGSHATYDRACLHLSDEEVARRVKAGEKHVIRIRDDSIPPSSSPAEDMIFGLHSEPTTSRATDTILVKTDNFPTYHFASVVDDHEMQVSHVIRGEEWLPSLPLHLQLYTALSWTPPRFAHIPLLLNRDGTKMSKRKGDAHVSDFIAKGWEPEAVLNWLALAGWGRDSRLDRHSEIGKHLSKSADSGSNDVLSLRQMEEQFDLSDLTHRRNILDPTKLEYLNRRHLQLKASEPHTLNALVDRAIPALRASYPNSESLLDRAYVEQTLPPLLEKLDNFHGLPSYAPYLFLTEPEFISSRPPLKPKASMSPDVPGKILRAAHHIFDATVEPLRSEIIRQLLREVRVRENVSQGDLMYTLRAALTGTNIGPSIVDVIELLGKDRTASRLRSFI